MAADELNFLEFMQGFRRGDLLREADMQLSELLSAIQETGGNGEITIKLPFKVNKGGQIECNPTVASKKPRRQLGAGIFYMTDEARLSRRDPDQHEMFGDELEPRRDRAAE